MGTNLARQKTFVPVPITERQTAESFSALVMPFSAGQLANAGGRSKETAKGWKAGRAAPNAASLINLARTMPTVRAWLYAEIEQHDGVVTDQMMTMVAAMVSREMDKRR